MPPAGRAAYRIAAGQKEKRMETHILVVEDDAEIREGVAIYLKNQGYTVHLSLIHIWQFKLGIKYDFTRKGELPSLRKNGLPSDGKNRSYYR